MGHGKHGKANIETSKAASAKAFRMENGFGSIRTEVRVERLCIYKKKSGVKS